MEEKVFQIIKEDPKFSKSSNQSATPLSMAQKHDSINNSK
jgi:hypothetical protein